MAIKNSYNFREINDRLTTSGVVGGNRLKGLADEGYTLLINLLPDDNEHAVPGERAIVEEQGVAYVYIPVDFFSPQESEYAQFAEALDQAKAGKVHVHCAANFRVSGFYARYARERGLWDAGRADAFVRALWNPDKFPCWVTFLSGSD